MRKRLVIGAIAIGAVVGVVYGLLQPKKGTVEWHEREYWRLREGPAVVGLIRSIFGLSNTVRSDADVATLMAHESALLERGRLVEHIFVVSNRFLIRC